MLKDSLGKEDFNLEDKFCDENELRQSWNNINIPEDLLKFFCRLFNILPSQFSNEALNDNTMNSFEEGILSSKILKMKSLYQIIFFMIKKHHKRTSLHIITGLSIHSMTKNKSLINHLNRIGVCISYNEVLRFRNGLALYNISSCENTIPLPSRFDKKIWTTAAFDNFDHEEGTLSGINGSHDTVAVLFQDDELYITKKPKMSELEINHHSKSLSENLK